jgi:hypothetical protein
MRKVNVLEFVSLDGVMQAPGGPEEDTNGGFACWAHVHRKYYDLQQAHSARADLCRRPGWRG